MTRVSVLLWIIVLSFIRNRILCYFLPVAIKVGIVDEFDEVDGLVLVVVVYGLELSPVIVGEEFAIAWSDVWIEQLHIAVVGDGVVQGQPLHPIVFAK